MRFGFYTNGSGYATVINLMFLLRAIKNGQYRNVIEKLRGLNNDEDKYGELKSGLPYFTPSGIFETLGKVETMIEYSPIIALNVKDMGNNAIDIREQAENIEFTMSAFISPCGKGVTILCNTDSKVENHELGFEALADFYSTALLGVEIDKSRKDISSVCSISYDPDLYFNGNAAVFSIPTNTPAVQFSDSTLSTDMESLFMKTVDFTEKRIHYFPGDKNDFVYILSNNLNRAGIDEKSAEELIRSKYPDQTVKIADAVKRAYSNTAEHNLFGPGYYSSATSASSATAAKRQMSFNTPLIPDEVYDHLPGFFNEGTKVFNVPRERDVFLTGALTILSGCFNRVNGLYDSKPYSPNLFSFIIAPPASGKGVLSYSRQLAQVIHSNITNGNGQSAQLTQNVESGLITHFIPADSSSAAVKRLLQRNKGQGTICETEADTLSTTLQQDWGGYDDLLRKAFHHETVSFARVGESDDVKLMEVRQPRLSICLSGTPSQVPTLLKSTANGLFSRIMFYSYRNDGILFFKNVFDKDGPINLESYFEELATRASAMYEEALLAG